MFIVNQPSSLLSCLSGKDVGCMYQEFEPTVQKVCTGFVINVTFTLIGYRKPPEFDYCFITSTSLVSVAVRFSIAGLRRETVGASNTVSTFHESAHIISQAYMYIYMFRLYKCT